MYCPIRNKIGQSKDYISWFLDKETKFIKLSLLVQDHTESSGSSLEPNQLGVKSEVLPTKMGNFYYYFKNYHI